MTKRLTFCAMAASAAFLMTACTQSTQAPISKVDLQHHNWILTHIDGEKVKVKPLPNLEIGEDFTANGNAGCNLFFGKADLKDSQFRIEHMGMTQKYCHGPGMTIEDQMSETLQNWSPVSIEENTMTIKGQQHTLTFTLRDWVN